MGSTQNRLLIGEGRRLLDGLRGLGSEAAPPGLVGSVLAEIGLEDGYWETDSPIGRVYVAFNPSGIAAVMVAQDGEGFERAFRARFGRAARRVETPPDKLARRVSERLRSGKGHLDYDLRGLTEFERAVLLKALEIPMGEVRPYAWVAREIGHPGAVRAVGTALGRNPIPLLIPCHRVVKSDGRTGNYAFGSEAKRAVLEGEGIRLEELEQLATAGIRFVGSDTTRIFCLPTCHHARRVTGPHLMRFASAAVATQAGYRPCRVCRPAAAP